MNNRYVKLSTKKLPNGKTVYKSALPSSVKEDPTDLVITTGQQDRMDIIAKNVYGDAKYWWRLAALNKQNNGSLYTKPGTQLRISTK